MNKEVLYVIEKRNGGNEVIEIVKSEIKELKRGEMRVSIKEDGVKRKDEMKSEGKYKKKKGVKDVLGMEI